MKISKAQYYRALKIMYNYHKQVNVNYFEESMDYRRVADFIQTAQMTTRLKNVLKRYIYTFGDSFMPQVPKKEFRRLRNGGIKSWNEFVNLRGY